MPKMSHAADLTRAGISVHLGGHFHESISVFSDGGRGACASPALATDIQKTPPAHFKKVSFLVHLPDYIPGLGTLYLDPAAAPVRLYLGYDRSGKLVNVTYMIPLKQIEERKGFEGLGHAASGVKIDHTDVVFNPGHPLRFPRISPLKISRLWIIVRAKTKHA
jgi:hypothetical protein